MRVKCRQSRAGPAAAMLRPARLDFSGRPARPGGGSAGYVGQTAQAAAWTAAPEGPDLSRWPGRAQDVTESAHLTEEGRGGEGGREKGEGEEERDEEGRGANDMVSWRHVQLQSFPYMYGPQGENAGARAELRWHAHTGRAKPARSRAALVRAQSHALTRAEPCLHARGRALARAIELRISI
jgi:hypothetical protein